MERELKPTDIGEFESVIGSRLSPHQLLNIDEKRFSPDIWTKTFERFDLLQFLLASEAEVNIPEQRDYFDVIVARKGSARLLVDGQPLQVDSRHAVILKPGERVQMYLAADYDQVHLRVEEHELRRHATELLNRPVHQRVTFYDSQIVLYEGHSAWLGTLLGFIADNHLGFQTSGLIDNAVQDLLLNHLLLKHPNSISELLHKPETFTTGPRSLRNATDFIQDHLDEPINVGDIAAAAGISVRSLQRLFREQLQVTPLAYIQQERLHAARNEILNAEKSISNIAYKWGFSHPSRFAELYRGTFNELPSQTRSEAP